jgi:hypothetical protein
MKSLDTVIESFKLVYKNPKIMLIPLTIFALSFIFIFTLGLFFDVGIDTIFRELKNAEYFSGLHLIIISLFSFLIYPFLIGMLISSGIQTMKGKFSLSRAFEDAKKKYLSLLGISLISIIIEFIFLFVLLIFGVFSSIIGGMMLDIAILYHLIIQAALYLIGKILINVLFFESNTIVFTENKNAFEAVERSFHIGKEKLLSIIATNVFFFLLAVGIILILVIPIFAITSIVNLSEIANIILIIFIILVILYVIFLIPVTEVIPVVFYYNYNLKNLK